jgi:hypothetical protein
MRTPLVKLNVLGEQNGAALRYQHAATHRPTSDAVWRAARIAFEG